MTATLTSSPININSTTNLNTIPVVQQPASFQKTASKVIVVQNSQSTIKGILWGILGFKLFTAAIGFATFSIKTLPLIVTPLAFLPLGYGVATAILASMTNTCINNASYHLGFRKIVVL